MSVNATVIQNLYNALASGDAAGALALLDDGVVWTKRRTSPTPMATPTSGRSAWPRAYWDA
jgi:ketosteroid isomerase-like protein